MLHMISYTSKQFSSNENSLWSSLKQIEKPRWQSTGASLKMLTRKVMIIFSISFTTSFEMWSQNKYFRTIRSSMSKFSMISALSTSIQWANPQRKWMHCSSKPSRVCSLTYPTSSWKTIMRTSSKTFSRYAVPSWTLDQSTAQDIPLKNQF